MILCLYGKTCGAFVEPVARDLQKNAAMLGGEIIPVPVEAALADRVRWRHASRVYVLPFDVPVDLSADGPPTAAGLVRALFPEAEVMNSITAHELCWDKLATARRLLGRGVPMPDSLITDDPQEAAAFVRRHGHAVLKEPQSCGGHGHLVVFAGEGATLAAEARGRRYVVELEATGSGRRLDHGVLSVAPPFYLQRLIAKVGRAGVLTAAPVLRAYIADGGVVLWTERYRERHRRPSDFIVSIVLGGRYRFLHAASEEAQKLALRAAEVLDVRYGVVDLMRTEREGPFVLEVDTDGPHMFIDRSFKAMPEFRPQFDFDHFIAEALLAPGPEPVARRSVPR